MKAAQDAAGAGSPQKKKRDISAKSLVNLRPNTQNMRHRGGSEPREYVTSVSVRIES